MRKFTNAEIDAIITNNGGFTRKALATLGVSWPPKKGWRKKITLKGSAAETPCEYSDYTIFCDGGCTPNPGPGAYAGIVSSESGEKVITGFCAETTNNRMEIMAAIVSLQAVPDGALVAVNTDSKYVIDGITSWVKSWIRNGWLTVNKTPVINRDLWELLHLESLRVQASWNWVRGHSEVQGNERADKLAEEALALGVEAMLDNNDHMRAIASE